MHTELATVPDFTLQRLSRQPGDCERYAYRTTTEELGAQLRNNTLRRRDIIAFAANTFLIASANAQSTTQPLGSAGPVDESSSLYPFEELCTSAFTSTFAYWIVVERKPQPVGAATLDSLYHWMSYHYDVEEQASEIEAFLTSDQYTPDSMRIIAPVTLAERWSPYTLATEILGAPLRAERGSGSHSRALGIWSPKSVDASLHPPTNEHERHFVFLLGLACSVALKQNGRIVIIGSPGWSYTHWRDKIRMMNPNISLLMHESGYLYTDRISQ
jgi:hypothetical protein